MLTTHLGKLTQAGEICQICMHLNERTQKGRLYEAWEKIECEKIFGGHEIRRLLAVCVLFPFLPSSTVESSCVTLTAILSILAWRLELRWATLSASWKRLPNISSAWRDREESCRMMLAKVPLVTPSSSSGTAYCSVPRLTLTGWTRRSGRGIVREVESVRFARSDYKYEWGERFKAATKTRQIAIKAKGSSNFGPCFLGDRRQENGAGAPNVSPLAVSRARGHSFSFGSFELVWETKKGYCCFSCWELEVGGSLR